MTKLQQVNNRRDWNIGTISGRALSHGLFVVVLFLVCSLSLRAQSTYGALTGTVVDTSGATEAGATVTLINTGTSEKQAQTTGETGLYSFVNLNSGNYRLVVEKNGFKRVNRENVVIQVQQTTRVDVTMTVGQATETVTVTAEVPLLQAETSSLGQVVEERNADELPLNGRNVFSLVEVAPSVVMQGGAGQSATGANPFSWGNFQIGGSFANQSAEYLDGQPLNVGYINLPILIPTQDSIGEFKVQTNNIGPEWGRLAGGVLNLSTKSGTNNFHGEAYEYIRNKVLNSNDWFSNNAGLGRPPFTQNQFGANVGGRILKDRTFFFYSYEGFRQRMGVTYTSTVPTADVQTAVKNGDDVDLSALATAANVPYIIDPCGQPTCTANVYTPAPFMGTSGNSPNTIPGARINITAKALMDLWPAPTNNALQNNYVTNYSAGGNQNQNLFRIDHKINDAQHLFVRFSQWNNLNLPIDPLGTGLCLDRCTESMASKAIAIGYNYVFTPNVIGNLDVSALRFNYTRTPKNNNFDFSTIGWPSAWNTQVMPDSARTPPSPGVVGMSDDVMGSQGQGFIIDHDTDYYFSPSLTLVHGRHTFQLGAQYAIILDNNAEGAISGSLAFNGAYTEDYNLADYPAGTLQPTSLALADYLLGWAQNPGSYGNHNYGDAEEPTLVAGRQTVTAGYINDTYHATSKLVLNLGLRYDYQSPWTERHNRQSYFNATAVNTIATQALGSTVLGDIELVDTPGAQSSRYNMNPNHVALAPRVGFAYSLDTKTVVRGGYGLFWIPVNANWATNPVNDPINTIETEYTGNLGSSNSNPAVPTNTITTPWPNFIQPPGRNPAYAADLEGQTVSGVDTLGYNYGYTQQWNLDLQRTLWGGLFADVAYAGNKGTHLPQYTQQINQLGDNFYAEAAQQAAANTDVTITKTVTNPFASSSSPGSELSAATTTVGQLERPFPQFGGVALAGQGSFSSIYHSLQATLQKRFNGGGTLLAAYTWAKLLSNTDTITYWLESGGVGSIQDWNNLRGEKSLSSQNVPQHLIVSYVLDLPFGKNKRYLNNLPAVGEKVVSGWGVDGITTFMDGFPVNVGSATNPTVGSFGGGLRPNVVAGCQKAIGGSADARVKSGLAGGQGWINSSCFTAPAAYTFGNESRVDPSLRSQGIDNFDFAAFKTTNFGPGEKLGFQFRVEVFNLFNHVQFSGPASSAGAANFGAITSMMNNPRLVQFAGKIIF
jgi:hypothetical protein